MRQSKLVLVNNNKLLHCNIGKSTCMVDIGPLRLHTARSATGRRLLFVLLSRNLRPTIGCKSQVIVRLHTARSATGRATRCSFRFKLSGKNSDYKKKIDYATCRRSLIVQHVYKYNFNCMLQV